MIELLTAFYPASPFWAGNDVLMPDHVVPHNLSDQMAECAFCYADADWRLYICRDGMFVLVVDSLKRPNPVGSSDDQYLNYINCILLLLESALLKTTGKNWIFNEEITKKNILSAYHIDNHFQIAAHPSYGTAELFSDTRSLKSISNKDRSWDWLLNRPVIEPATFDALFKDLSLVLNNYQHVTLLSRMMKSLSEYRMADKEISLSLPKKG